MRRFILTGAPGAGKTTILHSLAERGYAIVAEAATDIIAQEQQKGIPEPWMDPSFIELILDLQEQRQEQAMSADATAQFFDRSPLDTLALCHYLGYPLSAALREKFKRVQEAGKYERDVFFMDNLGFCEPTAARKISYEESLRFERVHEDVYAEGDYRCVRVPPVSVEERVQVVVTHLKQIE